MTLNLLYPVKIWDTQLIAKASWHYNTGLHTSVIAFFFITLYLFCALFV